MMVLAILLGYACWIGVILYNLMDENIIQVLMLIKMLGSVHKRAICELKAFLILFRGVTQVDMVKWA